MPKNALADWQPMGDGVLIQRLEPIEQQRGSAIVLTDMKQDDKMIIRKGRVLAVGPGKRDEDGERIEPDVCPGDVVLFNARWNDLTHAENRGTGSDGRGPLERPLSYRFDPTIHLVTEGDIAGKLA